MGLCDEKLDGMYEKKTDIVNEKKYRKAQTQKIKEIKKI